MEIKNIEKFFQKSISRKNISLYWEYFEFAFTYQIMMRSQNYCSWNYERYLGLLNEKITSSTLGQRDTDGFQIVDQIPFWIKKIKKIATIKMSHISRV